MSDELNVKTMRPGLLVTEHISLKGGIHYDREYENSYFDDKAQIRQWKTVSRIDDPNERAEAIKLKTDMYREVHSLCVSTPVGLICEESRRPELVAALQKIKRERDAFNDRARTCRLTTNHACFEVKEDNHETIAAIMEQIADVAQAVNRAITVDDEQTLKQSDKRWLKGMKPEAVLLLPEKERNAIVARARAELIRKAVKNIRGVERLLPKEAGDRAKSIVKQSRVIARDLCTRVERRSEALESVIEDIDLRGIRRNRAAFVMAAAKADKRALQKDEEIPLVEARKLTIQVPNTPPPGVGQTGGYGPPPRG